MRRNAVPRSMEVKGLNTLLLLKNLSQNGIFSKSVELIVSKNWVKFAGYDINKNDIDESKYIKLPINKIT